MFHHDYGLICRVLAQVTNGTLDRYEIGKSNKTDYEVKRIHTIAAANGYDVEWETPEFVKFMKRGA